MDWYTKRVHDTTTPNDFLNDCAIAKRLFESITTAAIHFRGRYSALAHPSLKIILSGLSVNNKHHYQHTNGL